MATMTTTETSRIDNNSASPIKRVWEALVRFWDRGGVSTDALYSLRYDSEHFVHNDGTVAQYYGGNSGFKGSRRVAMAHQPTDSSDRLDHILEAEGRFGGTISESLSVYGKRRKAS